MFKINKSCHISKKLVLLNLMLYLNFSPNYIENMAKIMHPEGWFWVAL